LIRYLSRTFEYNIQKIKWAYNNWQHSKLPITEPEIIIDALAPECCGYPMLEHGREGSFTLFKCSLCKEAIEDYRE
jgi:hypothetical protein